MSREELLLRRLIVVGAMANIRIALAQWGFGAQTRTTFHVTH